MRLAYQKGLIQLIRYIHRQLAVQLRPTLFLTTANRLELAGRARLDCSIFDFVNLPTTFKEIFLGVADLLELEDIADMIFTIKGTDSLVSRQD